MNDHRTLESQDGSDNTIKNVRLHRAVQYSKVSPFRENINLMNKAQRVQLILRFAPIRLTLQTDRPPKMIHGDPQQRTGYCKILYDTIGTAILKRLTEQQKLVGKGVVEETGPTGCSRRLQGVRGLDLRGITFDPIQVSDDS